VFRYLPGGTLAHKMVRNSHACTRVLNYFDLRILVRVPLLAKNSEASAKHDQYPKFRNPAGKDR
jgi:hypothetical protein